MSSRANIALSAFLKINKTKSDNHSSTTSYNTIASKVKGKREDKIKPKAVTFEDGNKQSKNSSLPDKKTISKNQSKLSNQIIRREKTIADIKYQETPSEALCEFVTSKFSQQELPRWVRSGRNNKVHVTDMVILSTGRVHIDFLPPYPGNYLQDVQPTAFTSELGGKVIWCRSFSQMKDMYDYFRILFLVHFPHASEEDIFKACFLPLSVVSTDDFYGYVVQVLMAFGKTIRGASQSTVSLSEYEQLLRSKLGKNAYTDGLSLNAAPSSCLVKSEYSSGQLKFDGTASIIFSNTPASCSFLDIINHLIALYSTTFNVVLPEKYAVVATVIYDSAYNIRDGVFIVEGAEGDLPTIIVSNHIFPYLIHFTRLLYPSSMDALNAAVVCDFDKIEFSSSVIDEVRIRSSVLALKHNSPLLDVFHYTPINSHMNLSLVAKQGTHGNVVSDFSYVKSFNFEYSFVPNLETYKVTKLITPEDMMLKLTSKVCLEHSLTMRDNVCPMSQCLNEILADHPWIQKCPACYKGLEHFCQTGQGSGVNWAVSGTLANHVVMINSLAGLIRYKSNQFEGIMFGCGDIPFEIHLLRTKNKLQVLHLFDNAVQFFDPTCFVKCLSVLAVIDDHSMVNSGTWLADDDGLLKVTLLSTDQPSSVIKFALLKNGYPLPKLMDTIYLLITRFDLLALTPFLRLFRIIKQHAVSTISKTASKEIDFQEKPLDFIRERKIHSAYAMYEKCFTEGCHQFISDYKLFDETKFNWQEIVDRDSLPSDVIQELSTRFKNILNHHCSLLQFRQFPEKIRRTTYRCKICSSKFDDIISCSYCFNEHSKRRK